MPNVDGVDLRSAEEWLAARGVERDPIRVPLTPPEPPETAPVAGSGAEEPARTPASLREVARLASEVPAPREPAPEAPEAADGVEPQQVLGDLQDVVADLVSYAHRATATTPMSEGRLSRKMRDRGAPDAAVSAAIARCRELKVVDDGAIARALIEEGVAKGHAPLRLRTTLSKREFSKAVIDAALGSMEERDPEATAFAAGRRRVERLRNVPPETAYRRLTAYLARCGHTEGLARKVARELVYADREQMRAAER